MSVTDISYPAADLNLARRLERTEGRTSAEFVRTKARLRPESGAACAEIGGTYAMFDGADSPLTQTFGLGMEQSAGGRELDELEEFFVSRGAPVFQEVSPLAGVELLAVLVERGYRPVECTNVMYRPIAGGVKLAGKANERIEVRTLGAEEHSVWARTATEGWREVADYSALMADVVEVFAQAGCWTPFLAELAGEPIAAGSLSLIDGVGLLSGASTIPAARKQGAQLALLESRLRYAAERGCELAMMCASPGSGSQRNAERHGFRIAYTRTKWRKG